MLFVFSLVPLVACLCADLVLAGYDDVLWSCGGLVRLDLQRVGLAAWVAVRGEEAVVLLHAQGGSGQLPSSEIHRQRLPSKDMHTPSFPTFHLMTLMWSACTCEA